MSENTRVREIATGVTAERIATETHIFYDPIHQDAQIIFQGEEFLMLGETVSSKLEGRQMLDVGLGEIIARTFDAGADPVTGADLSSISPAGVTAIIKAVYDVLHNERHAAPAGDGDTAPEGEG